MADLPVHSPSRYRVVRLLGRGAMGEVHLVHDREHERLVARKRLRCLGPEALLRFKREFRAVEQVAHENLVRLYELGEDAEGWYLTMEAVDGIDLRERCARGDPEAEVLALLPQLVSALRHLHARGIVHRDVKPSNVLVREDGLLKVLDFGIIAELGRGALLRDAF